MASFKVSIALFAGLLGLGATSSATPTSSDVNNQLPPGVSNVTIISGGLNRSYLLFIPPLYKPDTPTGAILSYHGGNRTALDQLQLDELTNSEFNTDLIVVYPQGIDKKWEGVPGVNTNDTQFTTDILNQVESRYSIDSKHIWATGKSDGGGFCNRLACDAVLSARLAAFAPVSGAYYVDTLPCTPSTVEIPCNASRRNIPFLAFHGGNDTTIPYLGGERKHECLPTIPHFIRQWAKRDGLNSSSNITTSIASNTVQYSFGITGLVQLVYDSVIGHDWPSTIPNADNQKAGHQPASFNATPIVLDFFRNHQLPDCR
ncbi:hypothetical protein BGW36DRAFT_18591 [Talaromyces proteolyticus]|uniref:feruloyl esterase n=1 Tax=Talaromyces proteolyticus TaxID=1131652 RepID=A0AAD4L3C2_9EURO|nr:uncharacterized protein BGW36DRAFT_18591 [Talaromyces proteolyticus]KAH8705840.1 hypothetical protein BGW36DRAFT_18591 [Talaromyces proteolyticus]